MKYRDMRYAIEDWWDDATEETKSFVILFGIFAAGFLVGAWVL